MFKFRNQIDLIIRWKWEKCLLFRSKFRPDEVSIFDIWFSFWLFFLQSLPKYIYLLKVFVAKNSSIFKLNFCYSKIFLLAHQFMRLIPKNFTIKCYIDIFPKYVPADAYIEERWATIWCLFGSTDNSMKLISCCFVYDICRNDALNCNKIFFNNSNSVVQSAIFLLRTIHTTLLMRK